MHSKFSCVLLLIACCRQAPIKAFDDDYDFSDYRRNQRLFLVIWNIAPLKVITSSYSSSVTNWLQLASPEPLLFFCF